MLITTVEHEVQLECWTQISNQHIAISNKPCAERRSHTDIRVNPLAGRAAATEGLTLIDKAAWRVTCDVAPGLCPGCGGVAGQQKAALCCLGILSKWKWTYWRRVGRPSTRWFGPRRPSAATLCFCGDFLFPPSSQIMLGSASPRLRVLEVDLLRLLVWIWPPAFVWTGFCLSV